MPRHRITQELRDLLRKYLAEEANRGIIKQKFIDWYRNQHKGRATGFRRRSTLYLPHPHLNNPYCKLCDKDLEIGDDCYLFYIGASGGGQVPYHVSCFEDAPEKMRVSIFYQDRAARKKIGDRGEKKEEDEFDKFIRIYRKKYGYGSMVG